ncbi:transposase domain-containing protein [Rhizobium laguerreae]|uniref:transposase domain-containing protein n=1 Tax=Rhizobium laguerreae TaxID=1076926 RepID=UPI00197DA013|nr:transposase domain-containing protein [Rhizobium laguerreae]NKM69396.1 hypothetical protein [Rhizobium laguerreae]
MTALEPLACLIDVITKVIHGHPNSQIDELLLCAHAQKPETTPWPETPLTLQAMLRALLLWRKTSRILVDPVGGASQSSLFYRF